MRTIAVSALVLGAFFVGRATTASAPQATAGPNDCQAELSEARANLEVCEQAITLIDSAARSVKSPKPALHAAPRRPISPSHIRLAYSRVGRLLDSVQKIDPVGSRRLVDSYRRIDLVGALTHDSTRRTTYKRLRQLGIDANAALLQVRR